MRIWKKISAKFLKKCAKKQKNRILLDLKMFLRYNETIRFRILKNLLPQKKYNVHINTIMRKILLSDTSVYRLSASWVFKIKLGKVCFIRN